MRRLLAGSLVGSLVVLAAGCRRPVVDHSALGAAASPWVLTWSDEFTGAAIDSTKWDFDLGNNILDSAGTVLATGWGNNELQCYTRDDRNVRVQDGQLRITARRASTPGCAYTSARLKTRTRSGRALFAQTYGRFEFRAQLPRGRGIWPALWMLPQDDRYGSWPASGEIDVMEAQGHVADTVHGTLHYGSRWPKNVLSGAPFAFPAGQDIGGMHTYTVEWEPGRIRWLVDDVLYQTQTFWWSSSRMNAQTLGATPEAANDLNAWPAPFDQRFYLLINLAVGGNYVGSPDRSTRFPSEMRVEYVRVFTKRIGYEPVVPRGAGTFPFPAR